jgi:WD40 repeat protein
MTRKPSLPNINLTQTIVQCVGVRILALLLLSLAIACSQLNSTNKQQTSTPALETALAQLANTAQASQVGRPTPIAALSVIPTAQSVSPVSQVIEPVNASALSLKSQTSVEGASGFVWLPGERAIALAAANELVFVGPFQMQSVTQALNQSPSMLTASQVQPAILAWTSSDHKVHVWSQAEKRELHALGGGDFAVTGLSIAPKGNNLAISTDGKVLAIWDAISGEKIQQWEQPHWLANLAYSPDGGQLGGVELGYFTMHILDAVTGQEVRSLAWEGGASPVLYGAYFSSDWGKLAWVARGSVQIMNTSDGTLGPLLSHEDFVSAVAWSPDGQLLATAAAGMVNGDFRPLISLWKISNGELVNRLEQTESIVQLAFSPDGKELAILDASGSLQVLAVFP